MNSHRLLSVGIFLFLLTIACVYSFSILSNETVEYYQISENIKSTDKSVNVVELSNKIVLSSDSKNPAKIKLLNPEYKTYRINHYGDNGDLVGFKIVNSTEIQCLSITEWSTYEILGIDNISYGDGWTHYDYVDGSQAHKLAPINYLRWDDEWRPKSEMNFSSGDWPYLVEEFDTYYLITRLDDSLTLAKAYRTYDFQPYKIGVQLTLLPVQLNGLSTLAGDYWYITMPQSLKETAKHLNWDNKLPTISNETGFILNQSENVSGEWLPNYKYKNIGDELRLYYNQVARDFGIASTEITFNFNSYVINGSTGWANTSYSNFAYDRNTGYLILPDNVTDGLVLYHKMSGSGGITSYDMNLTSDNNGTLTDMNTGLDNCTGNCSGWNSSGKYGNCIVFDGVDDYVATTFNANQDIGCGNPFTIEAWIYLKINNDYAAVLYGGGTSRFYFIIKDTNNPFIGMGDWFSETSGVPITMNTWQHFVTTYDGTNVKVYVNAGTPWDSGNIGSKDFDNVNLGIGGPFYLFNGFIDSVRIYNRTLTYDEINQTMSNTMVTTDNVTHWHDAGSGYRTASFIVNMTTPTNTNYTVWYADNGSSFTQIGGTYTGNQTPSITGTKYQNTDLRIVMNGNTTATPEEMEVTFVTETSAAAPSITSWQNNKTSNNTLDFTINTSEEVNFNATANQTITTWNWYKDDVDQSWNYDNITLNWSSTGLKHVVVNATNANGTSSSITWNVTVESLTDSSFTVTLPAGQTAINFTATTSKDTLLQPDNQTAGTPIINVTNTGNIQQSFRFYLNSTVTNVLTYISLSSDLSNPVELNTTTTTIIITNLAASDSDNVWMYCNLSTPAPGTTGKLLTVNSS